MISQIINYEFKLLKIELRIIVIIFSLALLFSFANSSYKLNQYKSVFENISSTEQKRFSDLKNDAHNTEQEMIKNKEDLTTNRTGPRSPSNVGNKGLNIMFTPQDLLILSIGQYDLYTINYTIRNSGRDESIQNTENPLNLLIGNFDPSFVILYLYPIFIIILTFDFLSSERERGILKLLLTQNISLKTLITAKIISRALIIFSTVILTSLGGLLIFGNNIFYGTNLLKTLFFFATILVYGSFWFFMCIVINLSKNKSQTNATILSGFWLLFLVIIPSVINLSASLIYPIPSRIDYLESINEAAEEERLKGSKVLGKFMEDHPELVNKKIDTSKAPILKAIRDDQVNKKIFPIKEKYNIQIDKQQDFINNFKYFSPAILVQDILFNLAESGFKSFRDFSEQSDKYQKEWRRFFVTKILDTKPVYSKDYDLIPKFIHKSDLNQIITSIIKSLFYIFSLIAVIYLLIIKSYKKYQFHD